jgi:hypothetical protein
VELTEPAYHADVIWAVVFVEEFDGWFNDLTQEQQEAIVMRMDVLKATGPALGRPIVDSIKGSRHRNMKELRVSAKGTIRILFAFDPARQAVMLLGGDKSGQWASWYQHAIPRADDLFDEYLREQEP